MKLAYRIWRFLVVATVCVMVVLPVLLFVLLSLPGVHRVIAREAERELSTLLDSRVTVGDLAIIPFNRVILRDVTVETAPGDTALTASRLGAGVQIASLFNDGPITINYLELMGLDARLHRANPKAPLNIQPIIAALSPKDKNKPPSKLDLRLNSIILRSSKVSYNVASAPRTQRFNPNHLEVNHLQADLRLPAIKNNDFTIAVKRMEFEERSGFRLTNLQAQLHISNSELAWRNLTVALPGTHINLADSRLPLADGFKSLRPLLETGNLSPSLLSGSYLTLSDLSAFAPILEKFPVRVDFNRLNIRGNLTDFEVDADLAADHADLHVVADARLRNVVSPRRTADARHLQIEASALSLIDLLGNLNPALPAKLAAVGRLGNISLLAKGAATMNEAKATINLETSAGNLEVKADGRRGVANGDFTLSADLLTHGAVNLAVALPASPVSVVEGAVQMAVTKLGNAYEGSAETTVDRIMVKGFTYTDLHAHAQLADNIVTGHASIDNPGVAVNLEGTFSLAHDRKIVKLNGDVARLVPSSINIPFPWEGATFSGSADVDMEGDDFDHLVGTASLSDLEVALPDGRALTLDRFDLSAQPNLIDLRCDYIDGTLRGDYDFKHLVPDVKWMLSRVIPAVLPAASPVERATDAYTNDFHFDFTVKETERLAEFFRLPVSVIYPMKLTGAVDTPSESLALGLDAPYLRQGKKLIEKTALSLFVDGNSKEMSLDVSTNTATKHGPLAILLQATGEDNRGVVDLSWKIDRERNYGGSISLGTRFSRFDDNLLQTRIDLNQSFLTFNDSTWTIDPASVVITGRNTIAVDGLNAYHGDQHIKIAGLVSDNPMAMLTLNLRNFSLDYLFETLGISNVLIGGDATGTFYASHLLSGKPVLETSGLKVENISYNRTVLGNAVVRSQWEPEQQGITIDATIDRETAQKTYRSFIKGAIFPTRDSLDLTFTVDHAKVGFLQPYLSFASDISGYASGWARLWGTFRNIDLEGDLYADPMRMKINFTQVHYNVTDSVHFRSGLIDLNGITFSDDEGHTGQLNGWVRHRYFRDPRFDISVTDTRDLLCYNEPGKANPTWFGKIYGNGSAFLKGETGRMDISVDMATAPRSTFSLVLNDTQVASEFSFLNFRDPSRSALLTDTVDLAPDPAMALVNKWRSIAEKKNEESVTDYNISLQMRANPDAQINLIMDPVSGDRIRAYGNGHLRLDYGSANNDIRMYGTYTLSQGNYNFTLQDIIIKDFQIKPGSRIDFNGDPYTADLNIQAAYALNANLSDLDESFLQDKDLNRTNVPVHAIMKLNGDLRAPEITFDLEFPTLTTDIYRKVRSIISTDDMMNRQIIYLLALNRFYTPEYMASTTKGNELVSVASSTISSQLSSLLGTISDNWNIAPTFRSDRGDFSDVEVDVALSSRLLNNRLLFNGNFGYRDNALNSSQFIGDFDLEYLLDRPGMWRLKAYNRYNDQNYYLRTAPTTQGVGVVLRRDFDSFLQFLPPFLRRRPTPKIPLAPTR